MLDFIWLIPLLPLVGFLVNSLLVWRIGDAAQRERTAGYVASGSVLLAFVVALVAFLQLAQAPAEAQRAHVVLWEWINTGSLHIPFGLLLDPLSAVMVLLVTGVGGLIHVYSIGYMHGDDKVVRYFAYLNLFIVMMLFLVMADNMLLLFLGWEGVGLCSFLLIGHWYERKVPSSAAVKAFVVNRVGDAAILLAMMAIVLKFGTLSFYSYVTLDGATIQGFLERASEIQADIVSIPGQTFYVSTLISFLLLIGVTGKSAQIPLFVWLPDAMAGPTPVSALIHAATMVTAGVYLMVRTIPIFSETTLAWVAIIGALTAFVGATAAIAQWDIKRVLAYSTVSQLGYMVAAVGLGAYVAAIFHLLTHGLFKALLFLGSGSVIHGTHETQDMRKMGGLKKDMPITFWTYLIGTLALAGIPIFAGFWSKDEIIAAALDVATIDGQWIILVILVVSAMLTAFYMARQVVLVFFGQQRDKSYHAHESGSMMTWPLIILAVGTIIGGAMNLPEPLPGAYALEHWLEPVVHPEAAHETTATLVESATHGEEGAVAGAPGAEETKGHSFNLFLATVVTLLSLASGFLGWNYYMGHSSRLKTTGKDAGKDPLRRVLGDFWEFMEEAWGFDDLYQKYTVVPWYRHLSDFLARVYDQQGIDGMVNGIGRMMGWAAASVRAMQSGYVRNYALMFLTGVIIIIGYLVAML